MSYLTVRRHLWEEYQKKYNFNVVIVKKNIIYHPQNQKTLSFVLEIAKIKAQ
jgi:hypothetical protein